MARAIAWVPVFFSLRPAHPFHPPPLCPNCTQNPAVLQKYCTDPAEVVAETCQLAVGRIEWLQRVAAGEEDGAVEEANPYASVDPAPPVAAVADVADLQARLNDTGASLPCVQ